MKRWLALILALLLTVSLTGCGDKTPEAANTPAPAATEAPAATKAPEATPTPAPTKAPEPEPTAAPDPSRETVTITVPADLIEEGEDILETMGMEEGMEGLVSVTQNDDGSVSIVMTRELQQQYLDEMSESIAEAVREITEGEDADPAIQKIEYAKDYSEFVMVVDQENASGFELFYALALCMAGTHYQIYAGNDTVDVPVKMQDAATGEVYSSSTYRELMEMFSDLFGGDDWETETEPLIPTPEVEPAVLLDQDGIVVTLTGITADFYGTKLNVTIENGSEASAMVDCDTLLVNDYYAGTALYATVEAGDSSEEEIYLPVTDLYGAGVAYIGKIDIQIAVYDPSSYERTITGELVEIRTSDYGETWDTIPAGKVIYDDNDLVIIYMDPVMQESFFEAYYQCNFCFLNNGDTDISVECESFIVDGSEISTWIYKTVPAGKRGLDYATLFQSDLEQYGIETPQTLEVNFAVTDAESYDDLFSTGSITVDLG